MMITCSGVVLLLGGLVFWGVGGGLVWLRLWGEGGGRFFGWWGCWWWGFGVVVVWVGVGFSPGVPPLLEASLP